MEEIYKAWLAGFIDGDGCLSISISDRNGRISICPQVRIALKGNDDWILKEILDKTSIGKIYYSNLGKDNCICSWQTTNFPDAIKITTAILPYLRLKKPRAEKFLEAMTLLEENRSHGRGLKDKGKFVRDKENLKKIALISTTINNDRQTKRYRKYKNFDYWKRRIDELYD